MPGETLVVTRTANKLQPYGLHPQWRRISEAPFLHRRREALRSQLTPATSEVLHLHHRRRPHRRSSGAPTGKEDLYPHLTPLGVSLEAHRAYSARRREATLPWKSPTRV